MSLLRHLTPLQARLLLALFACAMLARALVPSGWMPVATADGVRIVPCSGTGPLLPQAAAPMDHAMPGMAHRDAMAGMVHKDADHGASGVDHPCAFAGVTPVVDAPALAVAPPPLFVRTTPAPVRTLVSVGHGLAAPPPPQTGPPPFA
ncbi:hypothetical protein [Sphingomonas sp. R86521]|uniref:hypothetical protein n=1 Tax=Sphingomonas sp. R86521 TaxID=3093860 RepID=UPI0036D3FC05